jgi:TetR/AcrR family transcriptional regulator, transcriptional repressor for nem operon
MGQRNVDCKTDPRPTSQPALRNDAARVPASSAEMTGWLDENQRGLDRAAAGLMGILTGWVERQFRSMGRADARDLAIALVASYQGVALVTNTGSSPTPSGTLSSW